jgi:hypothetical protein
MPDLLDSINTDLQAAGTGVPGAPPSTDPGVGGDSGGGGAPPAAAAAAGPPSGAPPGGAPAAAGGGEPSAQQMVSLVEAARRAGYQTPEGMDDYTFFTHLLGQAQAAQQARQMQPYVQEYLSQRDQFAEFRRQQQLAAQQAQQKQGQPEQWWKVPEWDPSWRHQVYRDPTTNQWTTIPGTNPQVLEKYLNYQQWHQKTQETFLQDPIGTLKPGLEQLVNGMLEQRLAQHSQQSEDTQFTRQFLAQNAHWLYESQNGQPVAGPDGRPQLSHWGRRFQHHVNELIGDGLRGDQRIADRAYKLTDYEFALGRLAQQQHPQQAAAAGQQQKDAFLQRAGQAGLGAPPAQNGGPTPGSPGNAAPLPTMNSASDIARQILQGFEAAGITDRSIRDSFRQTGAA